MKKIASYKSYKIALAFANLLQILYQQNASVANNDQSFDVLVPQNAKLSRLPFVRLAFDAGLAALKSNGNNDTVKDPNNE